MAKIHGKNTQLLVGGYDPSNWFNSSEQSAERDVEDATGFRGSGGYKQYVVGLKDSVLSLQGMFDGEPDRVDEILNDRLSDDDAGTITWSPEGLDVGLRARMLDCYGTSYAVNSPLDGVVATTVAFQNDGAVGIGPVVASPNGTAIGFAVLPATSAVQDIGAAPLDNQAIPEPIWYGAVIHIHAVENTLDAAVNVILQHGPDSAVGPWVDLATLSLAAETIGAQRSQIAAGVEVDRYVRVIVEADAAAPTAGVIRIAAAAARLRQ